MAETKKYNSKMGFVYLVGAGPGDPGLITVKGMLALKSCDAVIYDNLVPSELIVALSSHIERHYVGKKAGRQCCSQDEINQLMINLAGENNISPYLERGQVFSNDRKCLWASPLNLPFYYKPAFPK